MSADDKATPENPHPWHMKSRGMALSDVYDSRGQWICCTYDETAALIVQAVKRKPAFEALLKAAKAVAYSRIPPSENVDALIEAIARAEEASRG
jgi:hypothetical protein